MKKSVLCCLMFLTLFLTGSIKYEEPSNSATYKNNSETNEDIEIIKTRVLNTNDLFSITKEEKPNNLEMLTSNKAISKNDLDLCGLKGSITINENNYRITYTNDNNLIIDQKSLIKSINSIKYPITETKIYKELNLESEVIGTYLYNEEIVIIGEYEDWYKVKYDDNIGYIKNDYISNEKLTLKREKGKTYIYCNDERVGEDLDYINLGIFKTTAYCNCESCCGVGGGHHTATGTIPTVGRTIAVDKNVIPYGTTVNIEGKEYIAEDTGSAIKSKRIDIYYDTHANALVYGVKNKYVSIKIN